MPKEPFMLVSLKGDKAKKLAQVMANPTCTKILEYLAGKDATESQIAKEMGIPLSTVHYNLQQLVEAKLVLAEEFHYSEKGREVNHYKLANKYIIIAPQEDDPTFLARLRKFVPITITVIGVAAVLKLLQFFTGSLSSGSSALETSSFGAGQAPLPEVAPLAAPMAKSAPLAAINAADQAANQAANSAVGGAAPDGARMMVAAAQHAGNETLNQTTGTALNETVNQTVNSTAPAFVPTHTPIQALPSSHMPWWQSSVIDYFLLGAFFVLVVLVIAEAISYWRWKRKQE